MLATDKPKALRKPKAATAAPAPPQTGKSKKLRRTLKSVQEQIDKLKVAADLAARQLESLIAKHAEINRQIERAENPDGG